MPTIDKAPFQVASLTCEYLKDPAGVDESAPRLGWRMLSNERSKWQAAYRILVATKPERLLPRRADCWDSGRIASRESAQVEYEGRPLVSRERLFWKVIVWDEEENEAESPVATWTMGLLEQSDWRADWIALNPKAIDRDPEASHSDLSTCASAGYFRKSFSVRSDLLSASAYVTARGLFKLSLNGQSVSPDVFAPEWTDYRKRIQYRRYDVTTLLQVGPNALGAVLGDGWYSGYVGWQETRCRYGIDNSLLVQLELEYEDGTKETVVSDKSWNCNTGPILFSDFMMGESYDARRLQSGWDEAGFNDADWLPVIEAEPTDARLVWQRSEPVRITQELKPVSLRKTGPNTWLCDLGQNISGWVRIRLSESAGTRIRIRHGERLDDDGMLFTANLRRARATDEYICAGSRKETWEPSFTFHGFQYFEVSGLTKAPVPEDFIGCVVNSSTRQTGSFECSDIQVNRLWLNGLWSQIDNFLSVPTDCPQRDERLGWMGDAQVFIRTASCNMNVAAFFSKWMIDVEDAQTEEGIFPDIAPRLDESENFVGLDDLCGGAGWADAGIIIPWTIWRVYGDIRILERHWKAMCAWMNYLERTNPEGIRKNELRNNYGDWLCIPSDTSFRTHSPMKTLLATAFWADDAAKMAEMAHELGKEDECARFQDMFHRVREAFQNEFVLEKGKLKVETQTAYLLALAMNLVPDAQRKNAAANLVKKIRSLDTHLSTGFIGIRFLNPVLTDAGYNDVSYELLLNDDYPSWLYPVRHGATTIWERWDAWTEEEGFLDAHMNSFNHYSFGSIGEWLFTHVAGIDYDSYAPGFQDFILRPNPRPELEWVDASYQSHHGRIQSTWQFREGSLLDWQVVIPANCTARVIFPVKSRNAILESGQSLEKAFGDLPKLTPNGFITTRVPSGIYHFTIRLEFPKKLPAEKALT